MGVENWPVGPDGQPEKAVLLDCEADFAAFGGITLSKLEAFGIPVFTNRPDLGKCPSCTAAAPSPASSFLSRKAASRRRKSF